MKSVVITQPINIANNNKNTPKLKKDMSFAKGQLSLTLQTDDESLLEILANPDRVRLALTVYRQEIPDFRLQCEKFNLSPVGLRTASFAPTIVIKDKD